MDKNVVLSILELFKVVEEERKDRKRKREGIPHSAISRSNERVVNKRRLIYG